MPTLGEREHLPRRQRMSAGLKVLLALVALAFLLGIALCAVDSTGRSAVDTQLNIIRAAGDPVTVAEIEARRPPIPDAQNGALILAKLFDSPMNVIADQHEHLPLLGPTKLPPPGEPLDGATCQSLRSFLAENADYLAGLDRMADYPTGRFPFELAAWRLDLSRPAVHWKHVRAAIKTKVLHGLLQAIDGNVDQAARGTRVICNIAGALEDEGTIMSSLIWTACSAQAVRSLEQTMARGVCTDEVLRQTAAVLERQDRSDALVWGMWGERGLQNAFFEALRSGNAVLTDDLAPSLPSRILLPLHGWNKLDQGKSLSFLTRLVEMAKDPAGNLADVDRFEKEVDSLSSFYLMTRLTMPSLTRSLVLRVRLSAVLRCARTSLALERYRLAHARWPDSLDQLVPRFLDAPPVDPFDGQPLRFRITDRMVIVYSIGEDKVDDGGELERSDRRRGRGRDVGFRLLNAELRAPFVSTNGTD